MEGVKRDAWVGVDPIDEIIVHWTAACAQWNSVNPKRCEQPYMGIPASAPVLSICPHTEYSLLRPVMGSGSVPDTSKQSALWCWIMTGDSTVTFHSTSTEMFEERGWISTGSWDRCTDGQRGVFWGAVKMPYLPPISTNNPRREGYRLHDKEYVMSRAFMHAECTADYLPGSF